MRLSELFNEGALPLRGGRSVNLFRNVALSNLLLMLNNSKEKTLRGLIVGDEVFWWDAFAATHSEVASVYDPDYDDIILYKKHRLALREQNGEFRVYAGQDAESLSRIPALTRLIARDFPLTVTMRDFDF